VRASPTPARPINPKFRAAWIIIPVFNLAMFAVSIAAIYAVERRVRR
jgi:hypothetical protein